jgi:hypothetical protein
MPPLPRDGRVTWTSFAVGYAPVAGAQDIADITRMPGGAEDDALRDVRTIIATYAPDARDDLESMIELGKLELG